MLEISENRMNRAFFCVLVQYYCMNALDPFDLEILSELQRNARLSLAELGTRAGLSASAVSRRLQRLEASGVIRGYVANLDGRSLGLMVTAFVTVTLARQSEAIIDRFEKTVVELAQVAEVHLIAGTTDYLLRVIVPDLEAYETFLKRELTRIEGVAHVQTAFSLSSLKTGAPISLAHLARLRKSNA